jgi:hypothetical protein
MLSPNIREKVCVSPLVAELEPESAKPRSVPPPILSASLPCAGCYRRQIMKRTLFAVLLFVALAFNASAQGYFTGAWYDTKAPKGTAKQAGKLDIILYDDGTCRVDYFYDQGIVRTVAGEWFQTTKGVAIYALDGFTTDTESRIMSGLIRPDTDSGGGKCFRYGHSGKWQVDFVSL